MRVIMIMFDSLNRHMLPPYGDEHVIAPNFQRLAEKSVVFDQCYAGSLPCMPARRELHTGRYNFLHRSWGPLEPYDDSMPEILKKSGVYTHLTTDHWHYWEEGGGNYVNKYNSYEFVRGQEGDPFKGMVEWTVPEHLGGRKDFCGRQEYINRFFMEKEENQSIAQNFSNGLRFIQDNHEADQWYLQLENFDPHEPFFTPDKYKELYERGYDDVMFDWPGYHPVTETPKQAEHCINEYRALVTMCDTYLGKVMDMMDEYNMWGNTMLIVNTDHGFLLTEHNWWGKMVMPYYNELVHIPLFIWDPRSGISGERRQALVQTIDLAPTVLEFFGLEVPKDMEGIPLRETIEHDKKIREYALFGQHGVHVNITDGKYVYMRCPQPEKEQELFNYIVEPASYPGAITTEELKTAKLHDGFGFTKGCPVLRIKGGYGIRTIGFPPRSLMNYGTMLFDVEKDPRQEHAIADRKVEERMAQEMAAMMKENEAPAEQFIRLGLEPYLEERKYGKESGFGAGIIC